MSETKFTKGPWFIWQELAMKRDGLDIEEITWELVECSEHGIYAGNPTECTQGVLSGYSAHICDIHADEPAADEDKDEDLCKQTHLANARLIAAAPDLYEALKACAEDCRLNDSDYGVSCFFCGESPNRRHEEIAHDPNCPYIKARAALAEARGEQP